MKVRYIIFFLLSMLAIAANGQIHGVVTDAVTGDTIFYPSASYKGNHVAVSGDAQGRYSIARHNGWYLTFSAVGYQSKRVMISQKTPSLFNVKLKPDTKQLAEVAKHVKGILCVEMSAGQMIEDVKLATQCGVKTEHFGRFGGIIPTPGEVLDALENKIIK